MVRGSELDIGQVLFRDEQYIELDFRERKRSMLERNGSSIEGIVKIEKFMDRGMGTHIKVR